MTFSYYETELLPLMQERLEIMKRQEESYHSGQKDYLACNRKRNAQTHTKLISRDSRKQMCQWCYRVALICQFSTETVAKAISYLDRFLCTPNGQGALYSNNTFQLAAMTAFYVATKVNESVTFDMDCLVRLGRDKFGPSEFRSMECQLLEALQWKLNGPTPHSFIGCFLDIMQGSDTMDNYIMKQACHQIDLALCEYKFINVLPSEIAIAALLNVVFDLDGIDASSLLAVNNIIECCYENHGFADNNECVLTIVQENLNKLLMKERAEQQQKQNKKSRRRKQLEIQIADDEADYDDDIQSSAEKLQQTTNPSSTVVYPTSQHSPVSVTTKETHTTPLCA